MMSIDKIYESDDIEIQKFYGSQDACETTFEVTWKVLDFLPIVDQADWDIKGNIINIDQ